MYLDVILLNQIHFKLRNILSLKLRALITKLINSETKTGANIMAKNPNFESEI